MSLLEIIEDNTAKSKLSKNDDKPFKLWMPKRVVFTADAMEESYGQKIYERVSALGLRKEIAKNNRITGLRGKDERETYRIAKIHWPLLTRPRALSISAQYPHLPTGSFTLPRAARHIASIAT
jgi:hypothetical protein